ncbi:MAG: hypothetical protein AAGI38_06295 [Bacteroidota bacterium]
MTSNPPEFERMRPYVDAEVPEVMERLISDPLTFQVLSFPFPEKSHNQLIELARSCKSVRDVQHKMTHHAIRSIVKQTATGLTYEGFEQLASDTGYLFLSNHRDIILDSAILNILLVEHKLETCEIGIGSNLLISSLITDLTKINRSFTIARDQVGREQYEAAQQLSHYLQHKITQAHTSIWLAHRNGRAKDGNDTTETGLVKMLDMGKGTFLENLSNLKIMPMAISYEYEPCDLYKVKHVYQQQRGLPITRSKREDLKNLLAGVTDFKGRIHLGLARQLSRQELEQIASYRQKGERFQRLIKLLDTRIQQAYKLWPTNFVAADALLPCPKFTSNYTKEEKDAFTSHMTQQVSKLEGDSRQLQQLFLSIYARPVFNAQGIPLPVPIVDS